MPIPEQVYQPSQSVGGSAPLGPVSADAYGAGVGGALSAAGGEIEDSQLRAMRAEKQRQAEADNAAAGLGAAQLKVQMTQMAQASRDSAPLDGSGHVENVAGGADALVGKFLSTIADPRVRQRWSVEAADMKAGLINDEDGWARGRRVGSIVTNGTQAMNLWGDQLQTDPDPKTLEQALKAGDAFWGGVDAPADVRDKGLRQWKQTAAFNYAHGLNEKDPNAGLQVAQSGILDGYGITPEQKKELVNEAQTNVRIAAADANRQLALQASQVHVDATDLSNRIARGDLPGDNEVTGVISRAKALEAKDPSLGNVVTTLEYNQDKLKLSRIVDKWTSPEWDAHLNPLAAKVAQGKASDDEQMQLKVLQELRPAKEQAIRNDPDGVSARNGVPPPQVDLTNPDPGAIAARKSWAQTFARTYRSVEAPYLTPDQLKQYQDRAAQGPAAQMDVASELRQAWGDAAPSIVRQIGGEAKSAMQIMLGLNPAIAQRYRRGQEALDKKAVEIDPQSDDAARITWGAASRGVPSDLQPAMFDAARKIAAGWMLEKGFTKAPANYDEVFNAALQYAAGRTGDVKDFNAPGGLAEYNGRYAWLPGDMSSNDFLRRMARAQPQDWVNAATDAHGNPVKSVPHYMGPDGKPKPYTKSDALRFNKGTVQTLDQGLFHLIDPVGHTVVDERGQPWTFDVRRLPR